MMKCVDASFIIRLLTTNNTDELCHQIWRQWQENNYTIVAPSLIFYEVANGLYRYKKAGQINQTETKQLLELALNLGIRLERDDLLHQEALDLAETYNLAATYDSHYLALAVRLKIEFWTADRRLFNSLSSDISYIRLV